MVLGGTRRDRPKWYQQRQSEAARRAAATREPEVRAPRHPPPPPPPPTGPRVSAAERRQRRRAALRDQAAPRPQAVVEAVPAAAGVGADADAADEEAEPPDGASFDGLTGIDARVDKSCEAAQKIVNFGYITGSDTLTRRESVIRITTGSQALDELLGGGIETLAVTEAFGEFRSGKTQLAHTLCVTTQLPTNMHGGNGKVAYIDTEGTFRPEQIIPIAERFGLDPRAVLNNISYARAFTYEHQYSLLLGLAAKMAEETFRLLIVDSVIALFHVDFTWRGELADRQQKLAQMLSRLIKIAEEFNVAVYMTNQVMADPVGGVLLSDPKKPAGGHVLAHAATIRLMFRKGKGEQRVCKVFDAPNLPEAEAVFQITAGGIADAKD